MAMTSCTYACWSATRCATCKKNMAPRGRSVPPEAQPSFCACEGASDGAVNPRHLWSQHDSDRAYTDPSGWAAHQRSCSQCRGDEP